MISLLKDIFNPNNWIKLFKNPKKINILYYRLFSYPGMNFKNVKIRLLRNLNKKFLIKFLNFIGKKNKSLNYFFYEQVNKNMFQDISIDEITFQLDSNKNISEQTFDAFKNYGIIVIKDVISEEERNKIINIFENFSINNEVINLSNYQKSNDVNVKLFNSKIDQFRELLLINKKITKKIFGKEISAEGQFLIHESSKIPESIFPGDNNFHMDRYLPNIKTIYFPYDVEENLSPFMYMVGSHRINNNYQDFYLNNDECIFDDRNILFKDYINKKIKIKVKKNSLVLAATNGFHGRAPFEKQGIRLTLFMTYPNFDLIDLFNYSKINRTNFSH